MSKLTHKKTAPILKVDHLSVTFNQHTVLNDLSFEVKRDDTLAIIGPNGAGKTVLFKCLLGLIPYEGQVEWARDVRIGYVPQRLNVDRDLPVTVAEFLKIKEADYKKGEEVLRQVGFGSKDGQLLHRGKRLLENRLGVLSGGEFQRVLIAFALLGDPNVLLFDEPTSGVDISAEETVYALIERLKKDADLTIIFISHELGIVYKHAANVLCLNKQQVCFGPPHDVVDKHTLHQLYGEEVGLHHHG